MATFVVLLVVVWGVGFLWFRGDLHLGSDDASASRAEPSATPSAKASSLPSDEPAPTKASASPGATYTGSVSPAEERKQVDVNPVEVRPAPVALPPVAQWTMATFNLLGSSHTRKGGEHARFSTGPNRMNGALSILAQHQVSVVGFQEFQPDQRAAFASRAKGWAMYPGLSLGRRAGENSVAWRLDTWEMVKPGLVSIPYFNGNSRPMPYVLLRNKATGVQAYFSTFHNPADTGGFQHQQRYRTAATSREITLFNELEKSGIPQFVTGDMNERDEYFCRITGSTPLVAAAGGSNDGGCAVPRPTQIDWIFGSPGVAFSGYTIDRSAVVRRTTDHPVVVTQVVLDALKFKNAYDPTVTPVG
jgi:hypothetical protein